MKLRNSESTVFQYRLDHSLLGINQFLDGERESRQCYKVIIVNMVHTLSTLTSIVPQFLELVCIRFPVCYHTGAAKLILNLECPVICCQLTLHNRS